MSGRSIDYVLALRPQHWIKNVVVFAPLLAAHESRPALYLMVAGLFGALSAAASGGYLLNDLFDLPYDRAHERKRHRPLAAGRLPLLPAACLGVALLGAGLAAAFVLAPAAGLWVGCYALLTFAYSLALKRRLFIDVVVLALLFTIRAVAGAAVVAVTLSSWFLAFAFFVFLALAVLKRQSELSALRAAGRAALPGRAYAVEDLVGLAALGAAAGMASVVVFALYVQSPEVRVLYGRPELLWLAGLLLLAWLGRMTLLAGRGAFEDDPVTFATRDRTTWLTGAGVGVVAACAALLWDGSLAMKLSGWGRYPVVDCRLTTLRDREDLGDLLPRRGTLIARGQGRSYGDAALNRNLTLSTLALDRMQAFDPGTGLLTCEAGVRLADVLDTFVPRGWFPPVVPGTKFVTIGGMIAADVHGKNHHRDGTFGAHVESLTLATADGDIRTCSRAQQADLFRATVGGMGLTGVILSASFRLRRIETAFVAAETAAARDLDETMSLFEASHDWPYSVAWIACLARGRSLGRTLVLRGSPLRRGALPAPLAARPLRPARASRLGVPVRRAVVPAQPPLGRPVQRDVLRVGAGARRLARGALRPVLLSARRNRRVESPVRPAGLRPVPVRAARGREPGRDGRAAGADRRGRSGLVSRGPEAFRSGRGRSAVVPHGRLYAGSRSPPAPRGRLR